MADKIKLKKGFTINLAGKAEKKISGTPLPQTCAIRPSDFHDLLRPKALVNVGDFVKAGTPVLIDKQKENIMFTSPVSGEVKAINRGEKRKLLEIVILADNKNDFEKFPSYSISEIASLTREKALETMLASGVWPNIIQRPFGVIADPNDAPKSIFISAFDTHPLAPDYDFLLKGQERYFQAGLEILRKFTAGPVYLNINADSEVSPVFSKAQGVKITSFSGPHPAGNVGVQIHRLDPIRKGDVVWTVNPFGVAQIGKLFLEGIYDATKLVALAGSEVKSPQYYRTYTGGCIDRMVENNLRDGEARLVSGNALTGQKIPANGFLGFYDNMVTILPEGGNFEFLGWIRPIANRLSFHRAFGLLSFVNPNKAYRLDTNTRGEARPFVQTGIFEKVTPMDILPTYLLKAILAEDYDEIEALGIYEVIEEDLALCEFVDVSKHDVQEILRRGINLIQYS